MGRLWGLRHPRTGFATPAIVVACAIAWAPGPAGAATTCNRVASPTGSDTALGSATAPYRSPQKLADSLTAGQTGCLRAGTYSLAERVKLTHGGASGAPITITSYPGERAKIVGRIWIDQGANYVTISKLDLDGINPDRLPSPLVMGNDVTFTDDDVSNENSGICFEVGAEGWATAVAQRTLITRNRIHNCGRRPSTNYDHGLYMQNSSDAKITYNLIYANADRGIQLYPSAQRTTISHNVIDRDGEGILFSGADGYASSDTVVNANIITNATVRADVEAYWPSGNPVGHNNQVTGNCIFGGRATVDTSAGGFTASGNTFQDPQYVNGANGDYHLRSTSPCRAVAGDTAALLDGGSGPADTIPPSITSILPADGAGAVPYDTPVTVTFSEAMDKASAQGAFSLVRASDSKAVGGGVTWNGNTMTFTPSGGLATGALYRATITTQARDAAGNALTGARTWSFTIRPATPVDAAPDGVTVLDGTRLSGNADSLAVDDGDAYQVDSNPVSGTASWYGSFAGVTNSLRGLTVRYAGSAVPGCSQTVSVYRFTDGAWVTLDSRSVDGTGADVAGLAPTGTLADYVSGAGGDGELRVRVACASSVAVVGSGELLRIHFLRP